MSNFVLFSVDTQIFDSWVPLVKMMHKQFLGKKDFELSPAGLVSFHWLKFQMFFGISLQVLEYL